MKTHMLIKFVATISYNIGKLWKTYWDLYVVIHVHNSSWLQHAHFFENMAILPVQMKVQNFVCFQILYVKVFQVLQVDCTHLQSTFSSRKGL